MTTSDFTAPPSPSGSWTAASSMSYESVNEAPDTARVPHAPPTARPLSTVTTSTFRQNTLNLRFSGEKGHPVHPRHFLKEFNIAMRELNVLGDREKISVFEDYLVVDSPAEAWYSEEVPKYMEATWKTFQEGFLASFPGGKFEAGAVELQKIKSVKFRQNAAVSAYIIAKWIDDSGEESPNVEGTDSLVSKGEESTAVKAVKLGGYKPIATEELFALSDYGVPEGVKVQFSSRVWGVGEYTCAEDIWFIHDSQSQKGADFRQSGTAFKGWFNHTGKYEV